MADTKISLLTEVTTPALTDVVPIVNAGNTKKVQRHNLLGLGYTAPVAGDFTWVNQGSASIDSSGDGLLLTCPATAALNFRLQTITAPATPYTITAALQLMPMTVNYHYPCLGWRQSSDGKIIVFGVQTNTAATDGPNLLSLNKYTSATGAYSATYVSMPSRIAAGVPLWLRIADDGTNRKCSVSFNGVRWQQIHSVGRTDYLTATHVFWAGECENATDDLLVTLMSWKVT